MNFLFWSTFDIKVLVQVGISLISIFKYESIHIKPQISRVHQYSEENYLKRKIIRRLNIIVLSVLIFRKANNQETKFFLEIMKYKCKIFRGVILNLDWVVQSYNIRGIIVYHNCKVRNVSSIAYFLPLLKSLSKSSIKKLVLT